MPTGTFEKLTLDYASPFKLFKRLPEADAILDSAGLTDDYRDLFDLTKEAALYYIFHQVSRYSLESIDLRCKGCDIATPGIAQVHCSILVPLRRGEFSIQTIGYSAEYDAFHSMCPSCLDSTRARIKRYYAAIAVRIFLVFIGIGYLMWSAYSPPWAVQFRESMGNYFYVPPMVLILVTVASIAFKGQAVDRLPPKLRDQVKDQFHSIRPFVFPPTQTDAGTA